MWLDIKVHKKARYYQPFLNEEKLYDCVAANEEERWADVYDFSRDEKGKLILDDEGNLKRKRLFGKVKLERIKP